MKALSPIERMIDAIVRCVCCDELKRDCQCAEGVHCGMCHRCATHCRGNHQCDLWWNNLQRQLVKAERERR